MLKTLLPTTNRDESFRKTAHNISRPDQSPSKKVLSISGVFTATNGNGVTDSKRCFDDWRRPCHAGALSKPGSVVELFAEKGGQP
jgi:hypothetical protein